MTKQGWSKKTDKIEVRLSPETKQAFHETCEQQGESASSVIRRLIEEYVKRFHQPVIARPIEAIRRTPWWVRGSGLAALLAGAVGLAVLPSQAERVPNWESMFAGADKNGDGQITPVEVEVHLSPGFRETLAPEQADRLEARMNDRETKQFREQDADGDGIVTREEYRAQYERKMSALFEALDDGDGVVTLDEFLQVSSTTGRAFLVGVAMGQKFNDRQKIDPENRDHPYEAVLGDFDAWSKGQQIMPPATAAARLGEFFTKADRNHDAHMTLEEFVWM